MDVLTFATLVVVGFTACAEFGSWAFVHPVLWRLPVEQHLRVEQGLLRSFGRVMPILMPASSILVIVYAIDGPGIGTANGLLRWAAAASVSIAIVTTVTVNVPGNSRTGRMSAEAPPDDWEQFRRRWERFQGVRSVLFVVGFVLICAAVVMPVAGQ